MSENNDKLIKNSEEAEENKAEEITGEDAKELKDEELEQSTGGYIPVFDDCLEYYERKICAPAGKRYMFGIYSRCPNLVETYTRKEGGWIVQYGDCKKGCFKDENLWPITQAL